MKLHAHPWGSADIDAAKTLRLSLLEVVLQRIDQIAREREIARVKQEKLTVELDHRLDQWRTVAARLPLLEVACNRCPPMVAAEMRDPCGVHFPA